VNAVSSGAPLLLEEAVAVIIRNERGRQVGCWDCSSPDPVSCKALCSAAQEQQRARECMPCPVPCAVPARLETASSWTMGSGRVVCCPVAA
jgi:hypothetical protein